MESDPSGIPARVSPMVDTVRTLFPHSQVSFGSPEPTVDYDFRFVPSARRPHLVVPARSAAAAASTVWRFSAAGDVRDSGTRWAAGMALRCGAMRFTQDAVSVRHSDGGIIHHLQGVFGESVTVSIAIGSARANRKPVLEVFDMRGRTLAFVKVGVDAISRRDVEAEVRNLRSLVGRVPNGLVIPEVIDESWWEGHLVLTMSALRTRWQQPRARKRIPVKLMSDLSRVWGSDRIPLRATSFWKRQRESVEQLQPRESTERVQHALDRIDARWGSTLVETGAWHGDWTPWNMAWRCGRLQLWDFERLDRDGLVGLDVLHYSVNEMVQRAGAVHERVVEAITVGDKVLGFDAEKHGALTAAYLASIALRYQISAAGPRGELIVDRANFMVEALDRWVDRP